ncbi:MAG: hypothetical protein Q8K70_11725 [Bacteroidota bacterium]|nr:hypothetical protein [Bacteroidota bacterium]
MKKIIIVSIIASFFAACNNTPAVTESATKLAGLTTWVDSIKNVISTTTEFDSASWAGYAESFNNAVAGINETELDEAGKTTFEAAKTAWTEVGTLYTQGLEAKAKAMQVTDSTSTTTTTTTTVETKVEEGKTIIEKAKDLGQDVKNLKK